jgi:hypothetical protein
MTLTDIFETSFNYRDNDYRDNEMLSRLVARCPAIYYRDIYFCGMSER